MELITNLEVHSSNNTIEVVPVKECGEGVLVRAFTFCGPHAS